MKNSLRRLSRILFISFAIFLLASPTIVPPQTVTAAPPLFDPLTRAVESAISEYFGAPPPNGVAVKILNQQEKWAFGVVGIYAINQNDAGPDSRFFIAQLVSGDWEVGVEDTAIFNFLLQTSPIGLLSSQEKKTFIARTPEGDGTSSLSLIWSTGETGTLTGGPHSNAGGTVTSRPWPAVDLVPDSRKVRAARDGIAYRPCANFVRINHGDGWQTGYYHLKNIVVSDGQTISRGQELGEISSEVGCGGSASGDHTHFTLRQNGDSTYVDINNRDIGGWTVHDGSSMYQGYMQRISDGSIQNAGSGRIYNDGKIGSGNSGPPAGYTFCANENQRCNFSGTKDVAYGANGSFYYKYNISGGIDCNNSTFGDPISGVGKACYTKDSSQTGCNPNSDQVALFEHGGYGGNCKVFNKADYPNPGAMGFANDTASSIKVGGNVKATLCKDDNYGGGCEDFSGDDGNLGDNSIGDNQVSSLKVQDRGSSGGNGVEFCDGTNYGSPCITLTAGKYGNLNDIGWYDRIESLRFKGNYVGNYHVVLSTETNHGGTPGHYERDEANVPDPWRNRTRSIEIYYIDRNNPPGTPALASPGDWYESNDGTAPNLCWNASSDPEGDNPVQYYADVFDSAVNGNSGWTTNTCWRPSSLDNQYFGYQWRVKARDNKNKESGWSETRHFTIRQPAPQKPDLRPATLSGYLAPLVPSSIQGTHQTNTLFANARTFIDWHFTNAGNGVASGNFYVDVYFDDQRVVHYPYSDFGAGGTGGFDDWAATFNATGVHKLKIVTDPENAIQESDENNNVWEQQFTWVAINGWRGEYFKNATLDSNPWLTRDDANIDFDWAGGSPDPSLPVDNFSARWTRTAAFECGRYRFNVHVDDGVRLWVNNQKILDEWRDQVADFHPEMDVPAGTLPIQVEYYEGGGGAAIQVSWQKLSSCVTKPSAPHDPNPANGASLSYRTELDVSVQGEGDKFIFHVWGNNYDRWSDWTSSRSFHLDGLTNQTYNFQAQARNSAGDSPWSAVWTFTIQPAPSQKSDLIIESITASPANPTVNQAVEFTIRLKNQGNGAAYINVPPNQLPQAKNGEAAASSFWVDFYIDRAPVIDCNDTGTYYWSVNGLAPGASVDLNYSYAGFSASGNHNLYAFADTNCGVDESNENNNVKGPQSITVSSNPNPVIPPKPTLLSPPNGNQSRARSRVLDWTDSTGATRYEIQIRQASKTGTIVASASTPSSNYKTPKLGRNYWYWWKVRACATSDPTSCSRWTKPWQYKVLP